MLAEEEEGKILVDLVWIDKANAENVQIKARNREYRAMKGGCI
jgi:hypothetical protein